MNEEDIIHDLILKGGLKFEGLDAMSGELLYSFTPKIKQLMPDLYKEHMNLVNQEVMNLWQKGFIDMDLLSDDPVITVTEKALDRTQVKRLTTQEQWSLSEIKRVLREK